MFGYCESVWRCRYFWANLVKMDLRTRYRRSVLGLGWSLLNPIAMTIILCTVFQQIMMADGNAITYAMYLLAGLATWNFLTTATVQGCQCFFQGDSYIRQFPAPLAIYPLRTALGALIHFFIALSVCLVSVWVLQGLENLRVLYALIPCLLLLFVFAWSLAVLAGFATVYFQDTQHLAEVGFQIMFFMTPIIYPAELLQMRKMQWLIDYNPLAAMLDLIREPVLHGNLPSADTVSMACTMVLVAASAAVLTLVRCQRRLIFFL